MVNRYHKILNLHKHKHIGLYILKNINKIRAIRTCLKTNSTPIIEIHINIANTSIFDVIF